MKAAAFDYVRPQSLAEAISILAGTDRDARSWPADNRSSP